RRPSSVLLPLPDGPMMAANCPRGISKSIPLSISTLCVGVAMVLVSPRTWIIGRAFDCCCGNFLLWHRVKNIYLMLTCLAIAGCSREQPPAREPAPAREARSAAPAKETDHRPVIVAFGDSLSAGFGADPGQSYPDFVQKELDQRGYPYRVVNA